MHRLILVALAAASAWMAPPVRATEVLINTNSTWQFRPGTNEASADIKSWRLQNFDDAGWASLPATFYYGETGFLGTQLTNMLNGYTCFFLRQRFVITNTTEVGALTLRTACDDGFAAWINGVLVASQYAPANPLYSSVATAAAAEPVSFQETLLTYPNYLRNGTNILAVQVFNNGIASSDIVFDAALLQEPTSTDPLAVVEAIPPPGLVTNLNSIRVTFSEPVRGVRAADLLLNFVAATNVTGTNATYTFTFAPVAPGTIAVSWDPANAIVTLLSPGRQPLPGTPGNVWVYEVVDLFAPTLVSTLPKDASSVRVAAQAEVMFDKPVMGLEAADLLINGQPATRVTGFGAGPYVFDYAVQPPGTVQFTFAPGHNIQSDCPTPQLFAGASWQCTVDAAALPADVVLNELVAENHSGLRDEEGDLEPWLELFNRGNQPVNLAGWSLTDNRSSPGQWVFPNTVLPAKGYLVVMASAKARSPTTGGRLHTNFKLSPLGEYLGLFSPDAPRQVVDELSPGYPEQSPDHAFGRTPSLGWQFFAVPTPGATNSTPAVSGHVDEVHFSAGRGFYSSPFNLALHTDTPAALIRYTVNGSVPTETSGFAYTGPILVNTSRVVRAAAFRKGWLPSRVVTQTYLYNLAANRRALPALSLVTATNGLYGPSGIMENTSAYPNTTKHGVAWERPVSVELIRPEDNGGFVVQCGLRVAGGNYIRPQYNYRSTSIPQSKYSFRLYFRGDYGPGRLQYPWFPGTSLDSFDRITLRAGMNDPTNPFIRDELARQLESDVGIVASHGTFVNLFLNGVYKGYYNPAEYIDESFLADYHAASDQWDLVDQEVLSGVAREGDVRAWNALRALVNNTTFDLTNAANYLELSRQVDLGNFIDYLLPLIYGDTDDWPHNNWRAARERTPDGIFRFYAWDAEWSFGFNNTPSHNTIASQLSNTAPPWGTAEIQRLFNRLKVIPEFKLLFADHVHRHFFNGGALTDERIRARYQQLRSAIIASIPGFSDTIGASWIPNRRRYLLGHFAQAGLLASSNAPVFSRFGGRVPAGFNLTMACTNGTMYYTTNGSDPRVRFSNLPAPDALVFSNAITLNHSGLLRARTWDSTNWSAVTEAAFLVDFAGSPLRITEIMYNPPGGDAYEFVEIQNLAPYSTNLQNYTLEGVTYRFPVGGPLLGPGATLLLASDADPAAFDNRYRRALVAGYFHGALDNGGERLALLDPAGNRVISVTYDDALPWPTEADGQGASLEIVDPLGDSDDPANWRASLASGGSPGQTNSPVGPPAVRLNEALALGSSGPDWVELFNAGPAAVSLADWTLTDTGAGRTFTFPSSATIASGGHLVVWCDQATNSPGFHTGFGLDSEGETLVLQEAAGARVDTLTFGQQVTDYSVGRLGAEARWDLTEPTPGSTNEAAILANPASLRLNEFLASAPAAAEDWIEIHNLDPVHPAMLRGLQLSTSNQVDTLEALGFVPPSGFVVLQADENPGPRHVGLKLPAAGSRLTLFGAAGVEYDSVLYGSQAEAVAFGRYPDGTGTLMSFPATASPGASNQVASWNGTILNEFLARATDSLVNLGARVADFIELYNPLNETSDLGGMSLRRDDDNGLTWTFPAGTTLAPRSYLLVWCDATSPATTNAAAFLNTGWNLDGDGGRLQLLERDARVVDTVVYGFQLQGCSAGRSPAGWALLETPTPGASNSVPMVLGDPTALRFNEWMADDGEADDWLEIWNPQSAPVGMAGMRLSDDGSLAGRTNTLVPPLTYVAAQGFVRWVADGKDRPGHTRFNLDAQGESLRLYGTTGLLVDAVDFPSQQAAVSEGRWPDGSGNILRFAETASPGASNYLPLRSVVLSEWLTHSDPPLEDAVELVNLTEDPMDVGGWFLSDREDQLARWRVPNGTVVPAQGRRVLYEYQFNASPGSSSSFELDSAHGGVLLLSATDSAGRLTGFRDVARFGAAFNGISFGRIRTSVGVDISPLAGRTFGVDSPPSLAAFRTGNGLPNAAPRVGPVVISEIMYHPVSGPVTNPLEKATEEFLELYNFGAGPLQLFDPNHATNSWRIRGGVEFDFPTNLTMPSGSSWLIVGFDPATETDLLAAFRTLYAIPGTVPILGPWQGRLSNAGDDIRLLQPDNPQGLDRPDAGFVPYVQVDRVHYGVTGAWPAAANGTGASLQRRSPALYGNEPLHWLAAAPHPGEAQTATTEADTDADGIPNGWEVGHGGDPLVADASVDQDGDGQTAFEEYVLGTDDLDPSSRLALGLVLAPEEYLLRFVAQSGRSYTLEYAINPAAGQWFSLYDFPAGTTLRQLEIALPRAGQPAPCYFRIVCPGRF